jgi:hypothetical protein
MLPLFFKFYGVEEHARSGSRGVDGRAGELRSSSERVGNHTSGGRSSNCAEGDR